MFDPITEHFSALFDDLRSWRVECQITSSIQSAVHDRPGKRSPKRILRPPGRRWSFTRRSHAWLEQQTGCRKQHYSPFMHRRAGNDGAV